MSQFGLEGYLCEMTPTEDGFLLVAQDSKFPEVRTTKKVKASELADGVRPDDRAQVELLFRPLIDELDEMRDKKVEKMRKDEAGQERKDRASARRARQVQRDSAIEPGQTPVAKDGTYPNMNIGENEGKAKPTVKGKAEQTRTGESLEAQDLKTQADTTAKNAAAAERSDGAPTTGVATSDTAKASDAQKGSDPNASEGSDKGKEADSTAAKAESTKSGDSDKPNTAGNRSSTPGSDKK